MRHRNHIGLLLLFSSALFLSSCHDTLFGDRSYSPSADFSGSGCDSGGTPVRVSIPFSAPMMANPGLRGASLRANNTFTVQNESGIIAETSRLLVFDGGDKLLYRAPITSIVPESDPNYNKGHVTAMLKETSTKVRLVLLPNLEPESIQAVDKAESGADRKTLLSSLKFNLPIDGDKLNWDPAKGLPMWGESTEDKIDHNATASGTDVLTLNHTIHLLRAVSRVDVGLNMTDLTNKGVKDADFDEKAQALKGKVASANGTLIDVQYAIKEVYFFNANSTGRVAPDEANLEDPKDNDPKKAKAVTLPNPTPSKIAGKLDLSSALEDNLLKRVIYLPEASNPASSGNTTAGTGTGGSTSQPGSTNPGDPKVYSERPYLVVGLSWKPLSGSGSESNVTYYRIDFLKRTGTEETTPSVATYEYIPLLRNHRYKVNISRINGEGFKSIEDAKKGPAANIMYNVTQWDESTISDILYDGQYTLSVTEDHFNLGKYGSQPTFDVRTSWPHGWKIEVPEKVYLGTTETVNSLYSATETDHASWIDFNKTSSTSAGETKDVVTTVAENTTGQPRTGYFYVVAGRMRWLITVNQSDKADLKIKFFEDPEAQVPISYIELHQHGLAVDLIQDNPDYNTVEKMGGYKRIYVQTDPYQNPNNPAAMAGLFPSLTDNKGDRFLFWDWGSKTAASKPEDDPSLINDATNPSSRIPVYNRTGSLTLADYTKKYPAAWKDPMIAPNGQYFRYTGKNNVWELIVTALPMMDRNNPFELKSNDYFANLSDGTNSVNSQLRIQQIEYNIVLYADAALSHLISPEQEQSYLMDGRARDIYVRSNIPGNLYISKQYQGDLRTVALNGDNTIANDGDYPVPSGSLNGTSTSRTSKLQVPASYGGFAVEFQVKNDLTSPRLLIAYADLSLNTSHPKYANIVKEETYTLAFFSATLLPEANSYPLELGGTGVLIPLSQIDKAAKEYNENVEMPASWLTDPSDTQRGWGSWDNFISKNRLNGVDDDDNVTPEVLWTDALSTNHSTSHKPVITAQSTGNTNTYAPLKYIDVLRHNGEAYLVVFPGLDLDVNIGNVVVGIRSSKHDRVTDAVFLPEKGNGKKALLWSFHLMMYRKGTVPKTTKTTDTNELKLIRYNWSTGSDESDDKFGPAPISWPTDIGAFELPNDKNYSGDPTYKDFDYRTIGLGYQWGRKDPFPHFGKNVNGEPDFYNQAGQKVLFQNYVVRGKSMSVRESIENPLAIAVPTDGFQWMTEAGPEKGNQDASTQATWQASRIWGGQSPIGPGSSRENALQFTQKTRFDPTPYGFVVPAPGYQFGRALINDNANINKRMMRANSVKNDDYIGIYDSKFGSSVFDVSRKGGTTSTSGFWAVSVPYMYNTYYPVLSIKLAGGIVNAYHEYARRSSTPFVRPVADLIYHADDYLNALPPYSSAIPVP